MTNTYLEIDYKQIQRNVDCVRKGKKACLMVKANNYGVGYEVIESFVKMGYDYFGVTTIEEARVVRSKAPNADILIVGYVDPSSYTEAIDQNFTLTVYDFSSLKSVIPNLKYHLKFDTGMGRIGFFKTEINEVKIVLKDLECKPIGIYSHFPEALNQEYTQQQIATFKSIVDELTEYEFEYIHLQNSVGCQLYDLDFCNMVRPGLSIWGYYADTEEKEIIEAINGVTIKPALSLNAKVHMVKEYHGLVGYDLSEQVDGLLGTIRIGYHDGFSRRFNGYRFATGPKVVGKVCMCQAFVLLDEPIEVLEIFGPVNSIYDLASYGQMTVYELLVSLSTRIIRSIDK